MSREIVYQKKNFSSSYFSIKPEKLLFKDLSSHPGLLVRPPIVPKVLNIHVTGVGSIVFN